MAVGNILAAFDMPLGKAALIALLGLLIVFAVLTVLVGLLTLFKVIFGMAEKKAKAPASVTESETAPTANDDDELSAVIAAAVACMPVDDAVQAQFTVKSIREIK